MSLPRRVLTIAISAALAVGVMVSPTAGAPSVATQKQPKIPRTSTFRTAPTHPSVGIITLQPNMPTGAQARANKAIQTAMKTANPDEGKPGPVVTKPYRGPAIGMPTKIDPEKPANPGGDTITAPGNDPASGGTTPVVRGMRREHAADPLSAFRVSTVADPSKAAGGFGTSWIGEPTSANDRNAILYTANWYAAYSSDNGRTWGYIDPVTAFPKLDNGFCCDQYAVSIPRDGYNNIAWVLQNSATATRNSYRLVVLKNRSGIESLDGTLEYCSYTIDSTDFDLPSNYMLDYPSMQPTSKYLYLSANAGLIGTGSVDRAVLWRIPLNGLETCSGSAQQLVLDDQLTLRPVNGAGSTMYFGSIPRYSDTYGKKFNIHYVKDSSTTLNYLQKDITDWPTGAMSCPLTSTSTFDPCARLSGKKVLAGYLSTNRVGWLFVTGSGGSSTNYPYTRVVRFDPSSLALKAETDIWNASYAWTYPSAGVTQRGDVGGLLTATGGALNPTAQAYIVDDISDWSPLAILGITSSDDGPTVTCNSTVRANCLGDYYTAVAYTGCSNTLLATTVVEQTTDSVKGPAHRWAWFGRDRDACVDLQVTGVTAGVTSGSTDPLHNGGTISVGDTTTNTGSTAAVATTTAYYLSRDDDQSSSDTRLGDRAAGTISIGSSSVGVNQLFTLPTSAHGNYYVIACADDDAVIDEVSDTNNCFASAVVDVKWDVTGVTYVLWNRSVAMAAATAVRPIKPGGAIKVKVDARIAPIGGDPDRPLNPDIIKTLRMLPLDVFLSVDRTTPPLYTGLIGHIPTRPIEVITLPGRKRQEWKGHVAATINLPRIMPPGRYWVHVCAARTLDDPELAGNCSTIKKPLIATVAAA